ncbi:hypothetical protein ACMDCT_00945 [Halomonadaceae bacterium KBTZ08]
MGILDAALNFGARAIQGTETNGSRDKATQQPPGNEPAARKTATSIADERVTLEKQGGSSVSLADLPMQEFKNAVARDSGFVKETIGTKLQELQVDLGTRMAVRRNNLGDIEMDAQIPPETRERIENDLNQNRAFKAAFNRLSTNQPTVEYLENVSRISQAYGEGNSMLESLVSETPENNRLQDIAHRYQELRKQVMSDEANAGQDPASGFEIRFNQPG